MIIKVVLFGPTPVNSSPIPPYRSSPSAEPRDEIIDKVLFVKLLKSDQNKI